MLFVLWPKNEEVYHSLARLGEKETIKCIFGRVKIKTLTYMNVEAKLVYELMHSKF